MILLHIVWPSSRTGALTSQRDVDVERERERESEARAIVWLGDIECVDGPEYAGRVPYWPYLCRHISIRFVSGRGASADTQRLRYPSAEVAQDA